MANIKLRIQNSWYTSRGQEEQKLGHWDLWQTSDNKFKISGTPAEDSKGKNWDIGTYGKHQTKNLKFLVYQQSQQGQKIGTLGPMANIRLKI